MESQQGKGEAPVGHVSATLTVSTLGLTPTQLWQWGAHSDTSGCFRSSPCDSVFCF